MYPGVYARISTEFRWIRESACTMTEAEQPDFCDITVSPTVSPAPTEHSTPSPTIATSSPTALNCGDDDVVMVELIFSSDYNYWETFWVLFSNSFLANGYVYYDSWWKQCIPIDETYTFTIYDSGGDGMCCSNGMGSYRIVVDGKQIKSGGSFTFAEQTVFDTTISTPFICKDSTQPFLVNEKEKNCEWVGKETASRCNKGDGKVSTHCPKTCGTCDAGCRNSAAYFKVDNLNKFKTCKWVGATSTNMRCGMIGEDNGRSTCPTLCGGC